MAALHKNQEIIDEVKRLGEAPIPWCDEYEKMISGMSFRSANDESLQKYRISTMKYIRSFNDGSIPDGSTIEILRARRMGVAKKLLGRLGTAVNIETPFFVGWGCNTFIGDDVYLNRDASIYDNAPVFIGNRTLIGPGVCICTGTHDTDSTIRRREGGSFAYPIRIGEDCWIGARATILPGVTIGSGCMIAAGAVVAQDIEPNCLVGGVPAKVIRRLVPIEKRMNKEIGSEDLGELESVLGDCYGQ